MPYVLEYMEPEDIPEVARIERLCFSMPWPTSAYRRELKTPETNRYIVARYVPPQVALGTSLREPTAENLTDLHHPELYAGGNGHSSAGEEPAARSLLANILPWMRGTATAGTEERTSPFPLVGYAGLWLMVDEAHVTTIGVHPDHRGRGVGELLFLGMAEIARQMRAFRMTLEVRVSNTTAQTLYRKYGLENAGVRKRYYSDNGEDAYIMWSDPISSPEFQARVSQLRRSLAERMRSGFLTDVKPSRPVDTNRLQ